MELERGVPTRLERPEVRHDVWLDPGMFRGDGASDDRCWRIRFRFFTVWKTRFGCSLERVLKKKKKIILTACLHQPHTFCCWKSFTDSEMAKEYYLCSSTSGSSIWSSFLMVPSISAARESWGTRQTCKRGIGGSWGVQNKEYELTIGNRPREWKRLVVLSGSDLFLKFFSSSWASWSISKHSAYLSCNSRSWITDRKHRKREK